MRNQDKFNQEANVIFAFIAGIAFTAALGMLIQNAA